MEVGGSRMNTMRGKRYDKAIEAGVLKGLEETCIDITGQAQALVLVDTGMLKNSIDYALENKNSANVSRPSDKYVGHVGTNVEYAAVVEEGSAPHVITIKNKKVLTDGKVFFGKSVNHPGTRARPYLRPAVDIVRNNLPVNVAIKRTMAQEHKRG